MIPIIDMHCDTIYAIYKQRCKGREISLRNNDLHVDLVRMKESGYMGQCFALRLLHRIYGRITATGCFPVSERSKKAPCIRETSITSDISMTAV